jgi:hypothetical protein
LTMTSKKYLAKVRRHADYASQTESRRLCVPDRTTLVAPRWSFRVFTSLDTEEQIS